VRQPSFTLSYLAPSFNTAEGDEAYALQILDEILSGGATSRLYRSLVVEQSIAVSAGSGYSGSTLDLATFTFYVSPRPGTEIEAVEAALRAEIEKVLADGVSEAEVQIAKQRMKASAIFARDNLSTPARLFGRALTIGRTVADVENWPDRIGQVTAEEVLAAARQVFRDKRSVSSLLLPEPTS
jgi:zinc protease